MIDGQWVTHLTKNHVPIKALENSRRNLPKTVRNKVWNEHMGRKNGIGDCWCCKSEEISQQNFQAGHIIAFSKGGSNKPNNLRPICSSCNGGMGNKNMKVFMEENGFSNELDCFD